MSFVFVDVKRSWAEMDELVLEPVMVYVRNITYNTWQRFTPSEWIDAYRDCMAYAVEMHLRSMGGELIISGTPEHGRITLVHGDGDDIIANFDWYTMTISQAAGRGPSGMPPQPSVT